MTTGAAVLAQEELWLGGNVGMSYGPVQEWYNNNVGNIGVYGWPCCQAFQTMCNGLEGDRTTVPQTAHCSTAYNWYAARSRTGTTPALYAQVFFDWGDGGQLDHVGLVRGFDANYVYTIEGNTSNTVAYRTYPRNSIYIKGYGYAAYVDSPETPSIPSGSSNWVTLMRSDATWRSTPQFTTDQFGIDNIVHKAGMPYPAGASIEVLGFVYGDDPYGSKQNRWVKSKVSGLFCWEGNFNSIDHLVETTGGTGSGVTNQTAPAREAYVTVNTTNGLSRWRSAPTSSSALFATYYPPAQILCNGWRRGESVDGNNIWVRSVRNGQWTWSGSLVEDVTSILSEV